LTKISVVIATHNRVTLLGKCLDALLTQKSAAPVTVEIIVVDDGSRDDTGVLFTGKYANHPVIRYIFQERKGPAKARNTGIRRATGEIVAFIDDDCVPENDWLFSIAGFFSRSENDRVLGVEGQTYTDPGGVTPFTKQMIHPVEAYVFPTCNIAYRRNALLKVGGFDENYPYPVNEDVDLGWQVLKSGEIGFCPRMRVFHPPLPLTGRDIIQGARYGRSEFYLYFKNPDQYRDLRILPKIPNKALKNFLEWTFLRSPAGVVFLILANLFIRDTLGKLSGQRKWMGRAPGLYLSFATFVLLQKSYLFYLLITNRLIDRGGGRNKKTCPRSKHRQSEKTFQIETKD